MRQKYTYTFSQKVLSSLKIQTNQFVREREVRGRAFCLQKIKQP